jgi:Xaa-Pro aminopeptidase
LIQRYTGLMPSSAVLGIDEEKKEWQLWLDSRYTSREIRPRSWWTLTKHHRSSDWSLLDLNQTYFIQSTCSIATQTSLQASWIAISVDSKDWWSQKRLIKSELEIETMKRCYAKSLQVLEYINQKISDTSIIGKSCLALRGECIAYAMSLGLSWEAFDMIVATGTQTASPHHETDMTLIGEWPLLIDMGRKRKWYCSDLTRCWWIGEESWEEYRLRKTIYDIVVQAKSACEKWVQVWMTGTEVDTLAREYITTAGYGEYFTHSTGHGIGLEVHEQPRITKTSRGSKVLLKNMCFTIEPWIYLPWKFGVRLEDSYVMGSSWLVLL